MDELELAAWPSATYEDSDDIAVATPYHDEQPRRLFLTLAEAQAQLTPQRRYTTPPPTRVRRRQATWSLASRRIKPRARSRRERQQTHVARSTSSSDPPGPGEGPSESAADGLPGKPPVCRCSPPLPDRGVCCKCGRKLPPQYGYRWAQPRRRRSR